MIDAYHNNYGAVDYLNTNQVSMPFTPKYKVGQLASKGRSTDFSNKFHKF